MEALTGNLTQLKLIDILRLLHLTGRTGQLELTTPSGEFGEIYLVKGEITHALHEETIGEEAVYGLFGWSAGTFRFVSEETTDELTVSLSTPQILEEAATYAAEWDRIRKVIPSSNAVYRLGTRPSSEIQLRAEDWTVLTLIDGERTVREIADLSQLNELYSSKIICRLSDLGLVDFVGIHTADPAAPVEVVEPAFISAVLSDLTMAIGPMAPIILDDCAEQMGHTRDEFPKDAVPELVERLANEIPDAARRTKFQEATLERLKKLY